MAYVYLYGMTVDSTIHRLRGDYPAADGYGEIAASWRVPGGEAFNAAIVLSRLGVATRIGGPWWGSRSAPLLQSYAERYGIDAGGVTRVGDWPGLADLVLVDDRHRTVFGGFGRYFGDAVRRWDPPDPDSCAGAALACIDPWFPQDSETAARACAAAGVPYVTIDCAPDSFLHARAAATVVSGEFRRGLAPGRDEAALFEEYRRQGAGLVVFSSGERPIRFGRRGGPALFQEACPVAIESSLGAGDVFRAGVAYGLLRGMDDAGAVRQAAALAALACTRMPIAETAPDAAELAEFMAKWNAGTLSA